MVKIEVWTYYCAKNKTEQRDLAASKAKLIDGRALSDGALAALQLRVREFSGAAKRAPKLEVLLVGDNPASQSYVKIKRRVAGEVGIDCEIHHLPANASEQDVLGKIAKFNKNSASDAIITQLPLPTGLSELEILNTISPMKDVDGLTAHNLGLLVAGNPMFVPATPLGVQEMLMQSDIDTHGANVVIIGRSSLVTKPLSILLSAKTAGGNATVTICHSATEALSAHTKRADILIVAAGRPNLIGGGDVKPDAVVIDVGVNQVAEAAAKSGYRLVGDVAFDAVSEVASAITPVPGGVGPMTVAMLMNNVVKAAELSRAGGAGGSAGAAGGG